MKDVLAERNSVHGSFSVNAEVTQYIMNIVHTYWKGKQPTAEQELALQMIVHKISRIVAGDTDYADHWLDIAGYATLIHEQLELQQEENMA